MEKIKKALLAFDFGAHSHNKHIILIPFIFAFIAGFVLDPASRFFFLYWGSAYLIGMIVFYTSHNKDVEKRSFREALAFLFPQKMWTDPSTFNDCIVAVINLFIAPVLGFVFTVLPLGVITAAGYGMAKLFSFAQDHGVPSIHSLLLYTLLTLVVSDFCYYWAHRLAHKMPAWWELHKTHHSAKIMTPVTFARYHPIDNLFYNIFKQAGMAFLSGVYLYLYPSMPGAITIMSSNAVLVALNILGNNLRHSHIWLSFGPRIERVFISPAMHQIHHSENPKHFDKNFGSVFSVWDVMFGTVYIPQGKEELSFGLGKRQSMDDFDTVPKLMLLPLLKIYRMMIIKKNKKQA